MPSHPLCLSFLIWQRPGCVNSEDPPALTLISHHPRRAPRSSCPGVTGRRPALAAWPRTWLKSWLAPVGESHLHWSVARPSSPRTWPGACCVQAWMRTPTSSSRPVLPSRAQARGLPVGHREEHRQEPGNVDGRPPLTRQVALGGHLSLYVLCFSSTPQVLPPSGQSCCVEGDGLQGDQGVGGGNQPRSQGGLLVQDSRSW